MLVLYTHGTDYSNSVAIVRLADVAALERIEHKWKVSEKVQIVTLLACKSAAQAAQISTPYPHRGRR